MRERRSMVERLARLEEGVDRMEAQLERIERRLEGGDEEEDGSEEDRCARLAAALFAPGVVDSLLLSMLLTKEGQSTDGLKAQLDAEEKSKTKGSSRTSCPRRAPSTSESCPLSPRACTG